MQKMLKFISFNGFSLTSKVIKTFTRSKNSSHIACLVGKEEKIIEAWNHKGGFKNYWDESDLSHHSKKTPYRIVGLPMDEEKIIFCEDFYKHLAKIKAKYNWKGVYAFEIKSINAKREGFVFYCSEGAIFPVCIVNEWKEIKPEHTSPIDFCRILEAAGGKVLSKGFV